MLNIGIIKSTHHLLGDVKVASIFEEFDNIIGEKVLVEKNNSTKILTIKKAERMNDKKYIVAFEEITNLEMARDIIGYSIKIRRDLLPKATNDDFYMSDLFGFRVYKENEYIGDVTDIFDNGAQDLLVITTKEDKEVMVPFVEDVFIKEIDFDNEKIFIDIIEGLL